MPTPLGAAVVVPAIASRPGPSGVAETGIYLPAPSQPIGEKQMTVRVAFCRSLGTQLQDSGRVHAQGAELASSAELFEASVAEDVTSRPLPDIDYCVLAHTVHAHTDQRPPIADRNPGLRRSPGSRTCAQSRGARRSSPAGGGRTRRCGLLRCACANHGRGSRNSRATQVAKPRGSDPDGCLRFDRP